MKDTLLNLSENPFRIVNLIDYDFNYDDSTIIQNKREKNEFRKFTEFKTLVSYNGLQYAKKTLNQDGNFNREYGKFLLEKSRTCLGDFYSQGIRDYFSEGSIE